MDFLLNSSKNLRSSRDRPVLGAFGSPILGKKGRKPPQLSPLISMWHLSRSVEFPKGDLPSATVKAWVSHHRRHRHGKPERKPNQRG